MKKIILFLLLLSVGSSFAQIPEDIMKKAQDITTQYQAITGITAIEAQGINDILVSYLITVMNGSTVSEAVQNQVDHIFSVSESTSSPLSASTIITTYSGELTEDDPIFHRIDYHTATFNTSCITQGDLANVYSGAEVHYNVIELNVTIAGTFDIEVMSFAGNDSYFSLYCAFDPLHPRENYIYGDDDGGVHWLSRFEDIPLPIGTYSLVISTYHSLNDLGPYTIEFRSDNGNLTVMSGNTVPVKIWWIAGLFVLLAAGIIVKRTYF